MVGWAVLQVFRHLYTLRFDPRLSLLALFEQCLQDVRDPHLNGRLNFIMRTLLPMMRSLSKFLVKLFPFTLPLCLSSLGEVVALA